jgi:hypothetical protein
MVSENQSSWNSKTENERSSSDVQNESQLKDSTNPDEREDARSEEPSDYPDSYETDTEPSTLFDESDDLITSSTIKGDDANSDINNGI